MIKVGQRVKYDPFKAMFGFGVCEVRQIATGVVTYINHEHGWFMAESNGVRTTFNFFDIGKDVRIVK